MANVFLENTKVFELNPEYNANTLEQKFAEISKRERDEYNMYAIEKQKVKALIDVLIQSADENLDYDEKKLANYQAEQAHKQKNVVAEASEIKKYAELLDKYGESFTYLYQIKEKSEKAGEGAEFSFEEVAQNTSAGILTQEQYFEMSANPKGEVEQLHLRVKTAEGDDFSLVMPPYDRAGVDKKSVKAQVIIPDNEIEKLNAEKLARILDFCETHGLSAYDMDLPYYFDGSLNVDEKFAQMFNILHEQKKHEMLEAGQDEFELRQQCFRSLEREAGGNAAALDGVSADEPPLNRIMNALSDEQHEAGSAVVGTSTNASASQDKTNKNGTLQEKAEKAIESFLEGGLKKTAASSYFKERSGFFKSGWTEYIVYDKEDEKNRDKDAIKDKDGNVKYTYNFKLFVRVDDGRLRFAYRTPYNKKIDDSVVNGMVGQFRSLGITNVRFPNGLPDAEKKLWRIALAENGIVPIGMGLDRAKAEGMLKAAKEKLSSEEYKKFRYRLAVQMDEDNKKKGKVLPPSERDYIAGLINSHKYLSFSEGYGERLKGMLRNRLDASDVNHEDGAVQKVGAYLAMRRLFDAYHETVDDVSMMSSTKLTSEEKRKMQLAGLTGPASDFSPAQMAKLYEIMLEQSDKDAKNELDTALLDESALTGPKRAGNIIIKEIFDGARNRFEKVNELLAPLGVDEISFPKAFGRLHYDKFFVEHPNFRNPRSGGRSQESTQNQDGMINDAQSCDAAQKTGVKSIVRTKNSTRDM